MRSLHGKRALVTGASGGIGRAIAMRLVREGARLALLDENQHKLETIDRESFGPDCRLLTVSCDLCDSHQIRAAVDTILAEWGGLDVLVNSAGIAFYGSTQAMSQDEWQRLLGVNLLGPVELTRILLPWLLEEEEAHIVNVSSMYGFFATNRCTAYHLTKFGLLGFSEALRAEFARGRLGVTALCPGFVRSGLFTSMKRSNGGTPMPPSWTFTTAEKVAEQAIRALYRNQRIVLTGWLAHLTYFVHRAFPGLFDRMYRLRRPTWLKTREPATAGRVLCSPK